MQLTWLSWLQVSVGHVASGTFPSPGPGNETCLVYLIQLWWLRMSMWSILANEMWADVFWGNSGDVFRILKKEVQWRNIYFFQPLDRHRGMRWGLELLQSPYDHEGTNSKAKATVGGWVGGSPSHGRRGSPGPKELLVCITQSKLLEWLQILSTIVSLLWLPVYDISSLLLKKSLTLGFLYLWPEAS